MYERLEATVPSLPPSLSRAVPAPAPVGMPTGHLAPRIPASQLAGSFVSGVGAECQLRLEAWRPGPAAREAVGAWKVTVAYVDRHGYFRGCPRLQAWLQLSGADGQVAATLESLGLARRPDGRYLATALVLSRLVDRAGLAHAALAFTAGGRWDSDYGRNYHLAL